MTDIDLASDTWTPAERLHWREQVTPTLGGISLIFCVAAHIAYCILNERKVQFPRLRVFPRSILAWLNLYNMLFSVYIVWKWWPISVLHHSWAVKIEPTPCKISIFLDNFTLTGLVASNTLIASTIFLVVKFPGHLEANVRRYFWIYLCFDFLYPALMGLAGALKPSKFLPLGNSCAAIPLVQSFLSYPLLALFGVQLILLAWTAFHIKQVLNRVKTVNTNTFPFGYLVGRLVLSLAANLFNVIAIELYLGFPKTVQKHAIFARFAYASHAAGALVDSLVFLIVNPDFIAWLKLQVQRLRHRFRHLKRSDGRTSSRDHLPAMVEFSASTTDLRKPEEDEAGAVSVVIV